MSQTDPARPALWITATAAFQPTASLIDCDSAVLGGRASGSALKVRPEITAASLR